MVATQKLSSGKDELEVSKGRHDLHDVDEATAEDSSQGAALVDLHCCQRHVEVAAAIEDDAGRANESVAACKPQK